MKTNTATALLTAALLATATATAQDPESLLFSPKGSETSRSGSGGTVLANLWARSVALLTPKETCVHSAEKFTPALGWQTLIGDEDGDGDVHTAGLMTGIDAILVKPGIWDQENQQFRPRSRPIDWNDLYISPITAVGTNVSGAPGLRPGDCATVRRTPAGNGQVVHFITAEQIITALGIVDPQNNQPLDPDDLNLDAIAVDRNRNIFLSLEEDRTVRLIVNGVLTSFLLEDGAIARIPPAAWTPDARGDVSTVAARRGQIVFTESAVDALVANAAPADNAAGCPLTIGDTDALAIDVDGGTFPFQWGASNSLLPHLMFAGETLTGCGVLTTVMFGQIAKVNNCELARPCGGAATSGEQMGVAATTSVSSLDGLAALDREPCRFVLGSPTPTGLGGAIEVHIGTNLAGAPGAVLFFGFGALPVSPSIDFSAFFPGSVCFPELYPAVLASAGISVPLVPDGWGNLTGTFGPAAAPFIPTGILFQAATLGAGTVQMSSPITLH